MKENSKNMSDLGAIKALEKGGEISFPISKLFSIRASVCNLNVVNGKKYLATKTDREAGVITVTRIS